MKDMKSRQDKAGIPERYRGCRLDTFNTGNSDPAVAARLLRARNISQEYVETFFDPTKDRFRRTGLLFIGPPGVGKTHLAVAVLRELIERYGIRGRFVDFTTLLHHIQSIETESSIPLAVTRADLLVLDELGAQKPNKWAMEHLYLIMSSRYTAGRPTIFTTNYRLDPVGDSSDGAELLTNRISPDVVSRLHEMAQVLPMEGPDYRRTVIARGSRS